MAEEIDIRINLNQALQELKQLQDRVAAIDGGVDKLGDEFKDSFDGASAAVKGLDNQQKKLIAETKKQAKAVDSVANEYRDLKKARAAATDPKQAKALNAAIKKTGRELKGMGKAGSRAFKEIEKGAGNSAKSLFSVKNILTGIGIGFGVQQIASIFRGAFQTIKDFEDSLASLSAITGLSGDDLDALGDKSVALSKKYGVAAADINEGLKLVGSASPDLLKNADALAAVTEQAVILSKAAGISLEEAVGTLTKSMNQYGASASEASVFTDVLATSQQKGTAGIALIGEALKNAGSAAKASGLSFEQTNVALQALAKGGTVGAEAGTKLRSILIKLAKTGRKDLDPALTPLPDIFETLSKEVPNLTVATKLFGDESASAALTLIDQRSVLSELTGQLNETGNALGQAETNMDTLSGKTDKASATWDAFVLTVADGSGIISQSVGGLVDLWQGFLESIILANKSYSELVAEVRAESLSGALKEDIKEVDFLAGGFEKIGFAAEDARKKAIDSLIRQLEQTKTTTKGITDAELASIDSRIDGLKSLQKEKKAVIEDEIEDEKALTKAQIAEFNKRAKAFQDLLDKLAQSSAKARADQLEGGASVDAAERAALQELAVFEELLREQAKLQAEGGVLSLQQEDQLQTLRNKIIQDAIDERIRLQSDEVENLREPIAPIPLTEQQGEDAAEPFGTGLKNRIMEAFQIDEAEFGDLLAGLAQTFGAITDLAGSIFDSFIAESERAVDANAEFLDSVSERVDTVEDELDREIRFAELGHASNVTEKREELAELKAAEEKALEDQKRLEQRAAAIKKKAALFQLSIDSARAISAAVAASAANPANAVTAGVAGAVQLAASLASIAVNFATAIAAVNSAQGFRDGVIDLQGAGTSTSDSIPARLSKGESVMTAAETQDNYQLFRGIRDKDGNMIKIGVQHLLESNGIKLDAALPTRIATGVQTVERYRSESKDKLISKLVESNEGLELMVQNILAEMRHGEKIAQADGSVIKRRGNTITKIKRNGN